MMNNHAGLRRFGSICSNGFAVVICLFPCYLLADGVAVKSPTGPTSCTTVNLGQMHRRDGGPHLAFLSMPPVITSKFCRLDAPSMPRLASARRSPPRMAEDDSASPSEELWASLRRRIPSGGEGAVASPTDPAVRHFELHICWHGIQFLHCIHDAFR